MPSTSDISWQCETNPKCQPIFRCGSRADKTDQQFFAPSARAAVISVLLVMLQCIEQMVFMILQPLRHWLQHRSHFARRIGGSHCLDRASKLRVLSYLGPTQTWWNQISAGGRLQGIVTFGPGRSLSLNRFTCFEHSYSRLSFSQFPWVRTGCVAKDWLWSSDVGLDVGTQLVIAEDSMEARGWVPFFLSFWPVRTDFRVSFN